MLKLQPPSFHVGGDTAAIAGSEYDNLSEEDLVKLIRQSHKLKTGREGSIQPSRPVMSKPVVNLENILGGL